MTEREYMLAANVARVRVMLDVHRMSEPMVGIISEDEWHVVGMRLSRWEQALSQEIEAATEQGTA